MTAAGAPIRLVVVAAVGTVLALHLVDVLAPHQHFPLFAAVIAGIGACVAAQVAFGRGHGRPWRKRLVDAGCVAAAVATAALVPEWIEAEMRSGKGVALGALVDHGLPVLLALSLTIYGAIVLMVADVMYDEVFGYDR